MTEFDYVEEYEKRFAKCFDEAKKSMCKLYDDLDDKCMQEAIDHFEEVADADEVIGYYLSHYESDAYKVWRKNTEHIDMNEKDKIVEETLRKLFGDEYL